MISLQQMPKGDFNKSTSQIYTNDTNNNMISASLVGDSQSTKRGSAGKLLDNETLLVILSTVLKTQHTSTTTRKLSKHQSTTSTQYQTPSVPCSHTQSETMVPGTK